MNLFHPPFGRRLTLAAAAVACALGAAPALGQTAFGAAPTIVFPVVAKTATFTSFVTIYNPNSTAVMLDLDYFDANQYPEPRAKVCDNNVGIPARSSVEFQLPEHCALGAGDHSGQLIVSAGTDPIFGYSRTQNNAGAGFSIEGFPVANFSTGTTYVVGLKRQTAAPTYQTNCFVAAEAAVVSYEIRLYDGANGAPIGNVLSGSLDAFAEIRHLDIFGAVSAPAGDYSNVIAEFTRTSDGEQQMIGFCTVQDNTSFGADFRIAKALTPPAPPPPPPPPTGVLAGTWHGGIPALDLPGGPLVFAGPTASVTLGTAGTLSAFGGGWFSKQSSGNGSLSLGVCYQTGSGPITVMGTPATVTVTHSQTWQYATGSATIGAGSYNVGLCAQNLGTNSVNKNGTTSGFVFVSP